MEYAIIMESNLERILSIFEDIKSNKWDVESPLKWGFFFMSNDKRNFGKIYKELKDYNYKKESIHKTDDGIWVLQVSKIEVLEPEKLHRRNLAFKELAETYNSIYDGWDVGKNNILHKTDLMIYTKTH